ncbi:hypothetical protein Rvan_3402 [Rhodomicrobium vannielii ATCC 17100]|uniref:Response regulatory domain-containing protein n=1 Tax=Rhodomicrobium vannielii (strain ATCC 17100 / DSM 162 / LMG 4299 / NCIMB 10020 / ATH 3.1.1) TaxID=648757 RepID=E3I3D7_RHOVT|nr:hypothetical protein Rvan_3402 [Rhodomicrobium vannielii ATCC 17100]
MLWSSPRTAIRRALESVLAPQLLIVELDNARRVDTAFIGRLKAAKFETVPVVVISNLLDPETVGALVRLRVDDFLSSDCTIGEFHKACQHALKQHARETPGRATSCYSFFPVSGGCGNTTLAIQSAFLIGRRNGMSNVCLVDLNLQDGAVADYLDLAPSFRIDEVASSPARLDRQLLDVMLSRHSSGLSVLAAPRCPARHINVSAETVALVLGLLSQSFSTIVVDLPKTWHAWTENVVWGSNRVFIVSSFTVPALRQARAVSEAIAGVAGADAAVSVIVNRYHESLFGGGLQKKDAERALGDSLAGFIPDLGNVVLEAINRGLPLSAIYTRDVQDERRRSARLARRCPQTASRTPSQPYRRPPAMELEKASRPVKGLGAGEGRAGPAGKGDTEDPRAASWGGVRKGLDV